MSKKKSEDNFVEDMSNSFLSIFDNKESRELDRLTKKFWSQL